MNSRFRMRDRRPGQEMMTVRASDIRRIAEYDQHPDLSYLEPDADPVHAAANAERLQAYGRGEWHFIAIRAQAKFMIPMGEQAAVIQSVESPGLYGIESDSSPEHRDEIFKAEKANLCAMLRQMNVTVVDD